MMKAKLTSILGVGMLVMAIVGLLLYMDGKSTKAERDMVVGDHAKLEQEIAKIVTDNRLAIEAAKLVSVDNNNILKQLLSQSEGRITQTIIENRRYSNDNNDRLKKLQEQMDRIEALLLKEKK